MELMKTNDLLDAVKVLENLSSDYALSKRLGVKTQTISSYRTGRTVLDVEMCFRIAELLKFDPAQVTAWMEAERAERAHREADAARWTERARKLAGIAAAVLVALGIGSPRPAEAASTTSDARATVHYVNRKRRGKREAVAAVMASTATLLSAPWTRPV